MSSVEAKALYDFEGGGDGELEFRAGETLTVTNQDVGDGWWEAKNLSGRAGYVPQDFLQIISVPEPKMPLPPPPPPAATYRTSVTQSTPAVASYQTSVRAAAAGSGAGAGGEGDWGDDGFDDEDDWDSDDETGGSASTANQPRMYQARQSNATAGGYNSDGDSVGYADSEAYREPKVETTRRGIGKFSSTFVKQGGEGYLLGIGNMEPPTTFIDVVMGPDGQPTWKSTGQSYACSISHPHKASKFKGIKSFIAYQLTPSYSNLQVSRRYKHFDWLHARLEEKFIAVNIPPLPDKQVSGRFEDDFVTQRMYQLQLWLNRMIRHPVISQSDLLLSFFTPLDDKQWKKTKRTAEKDDYVGGKFFLSIRTPADSPLDLPDTEKRVSDFWMFLKKFDSSVKSLSQVAEGQQRACQSSWKREYEKMSSGFLALSDAFTADIASGRARESRLLGEKFKTVSEAYGRIGETLSTESSNSVSDYVSALGEYKGICSTLPHVLHFHKGTATTISNLNKTGATDAEIHESTKRAETVSYGVLAEINHFHDNRISDFKQSTGEFLRSQIDFYSKVVSELQAALKEVDAP